MSLIDELNKLKREIEIIKRESKNIKGFPIIQGYAGKKFTLNDHLDVIKLNKKLNEIDDRLTKLINNEIGSHTHSELHAGDTVQLEVTEEGIIKLSHSWGLIPKDGELLIVEQNGDGSWPTKGFSVKSY